MLLNVKRIDVPPGQPVLLRDVTWQESTASFIPWLPDSLTPWLPGWLTYLIDK